MKPLSILLIFCGESDQAISVKSLVRSIAHLGRFRQADNFESICLFLKKAVI